MLILLQDVSPRRLAERSRDRLAAQVALLGEISEAFAGTLDGEEALRRLATQVVPTLGDWVTLETCDSRGVPHRVTVHHRDPDVADLVRAADEILPVPLSQRLGDRRRPDGSVLLADVDAATLTSLFPEAEHRELVRRLGAVSVLVVPLPGRDRLLGSMTLLNGLTSPAFTEQDVAVAGEVGRRAGVALETMGLYAEQRDLAEGLQRSLLSDPVEPRDGEVVVRYVAAAQEAQVGGDWYDVFVQPDGSTVLVIGDVVGHDTRAAAAMGQLRGLLRGIGYASEAGPAEMLCRLDAAIDGLRISTTATAVVAVLAADADDSGGSTRLRWSNAGHPPPLLLVPGSAPRLLDGHATNLLLGVVADAHRDEHLIDLDEGAVLLLYTDGLVERRGQDLDDGLDQLLSAVGELGDLPLAQLCDELLHRLVPERHDDDVALAAIRLHRPARA
jgi:serine phosphatase RsbU (regulator of sigma subunit)